MVWCSVTVVEVEEFAKGTRTVVRVFSGSGKVGMFAGRMQCVRLMEREWEELFLNSWSPFFTVAS